MNAAKVISDNWNDIHSEIVSRFNEFKMSFGDIDISNKMMSELISAVVETAFANVLRSKQIDVETPKKDSEPDAYVMGEAVEIKTTSGDNWRGGAFSKRPGLYVLVSWTYDAQEGTKLFAAMQKMQKSDWFSSNLDEGGNFKEGSNYYATVYGKKNLVEDARYQILSGQVQVKAYKKNGQPMAKPSIKLILA